MLARPVDALPIGDAMTGGCLYEPKFDGYRALLFVTADGCRVQSRRGHDMTEAFSDVAEAAAESLPDGVVVDGELVVWARDALDFNELQRRFASGRSKGPVRARPPASFVAFDLLAAEGVDLRQQPLSARRALLETVLDGVPPPLQLVPQTDDADEARAWLAEYAENPVGIEGVVVKGRTSTYLSGRREWAKLRIRDTVEAVVAGVTGSPAAPDRLVLALAEEGGGLAFAGTTTELDRHQRAEVVALLEDVEEGRPHPWADGRPDGEVARWGRNARAAVHLMRPTLVVEVSTDSSVDRGRWRHPVTFVRARPDLTPSETTGA
ncbi:ATP-dependent DNA ligase [Aeromicrobium endophyticum]|uniref:DNA ligase (ATP) n=2 Tax=Aeromicrobium endophyticum TaxID=2292704 RepID=A0A371P942_9ACTN|nr:ATP-dependent DNA ligase [Aeromicrobium endophyticum]